jgi:hypothetical protein
LDSLHFARAFRLVTLYAGRRIDDWYNVLEIYDSKTMTSFLKHAGFAAHGQVPDVGRFLQEQVFVTKATLLDAVGRTLAR